MFTVCTVKCKSTDIIDVILLDFFTDVLLCKTTTTHLNVEIGWGGVNFNYFILLGSLIFKNTSHLMSWDMKHNVSNLTAILYFWNQFTLLLYCLIFT